MRQLPTVTDEHRAAAHACGLNFRCMNPQWAQLHGHARDCTRVAEAFAARDAASQAQRDRLAEAERFVRRVAKMGRAVIQPTKREREAIAMVDRWDLGKCKTCGCTGGNGTWIVTDDKGNPVMTQRCPDCASNPLDVGHCPNHPELKCVGVARKNGLCVFTCYRDNRARPLISDHKFHDDGGGDWCRVDLGRGDDSYQPCGHPSADHEP